MSLRIIVDKPSDGGVRGHLCNSCLSSSHITGPGGYEKWYCNTLSTYMTHEVNNCNMFRSKEEKYEAPKDILNIALTLTKHDDLIMWLNNNQVTQWSNVYESEERDLLLSKWGYV